MKELDFSLATTSEIIKELASRAKYKRKQDKARYGTQKQFAEHIGMSFRSYQEFEINGKISLDKFIDVLRGLDNLEQNQNILQIGNDELFRVGINIKKSFSKTTMEQKIVIPNVFK